MDLEKGETRMNQCKEAECAGDLQKELSEIYKLNEEQNSMSEEVNTITYGCSQFFTIMCC